MAETPVPKLSFHGHCPDCGERQVEALPPLPPLGDDFDWQLRDYDSFRRFMQEELSARFPERNRWTAGDLEVVLIEILATVLDQLSDMCDRVASEAFLETARRPESVRRHLKLIGYDAVVIAQARGYIASTSDEDSVKALEQFWSREPHMMDLARREGPLQIQTQHRMVSVADHASQLENHPLVLRAQSWSEWGGSWSVVRIAVVGWNNLDIDATADEATGYPDELKQEVKTFHQERKLHLPDLDDGPAIRTILRPYIDAYRMAGQQVILENAQPVGIAMNISIRIGDDFLQSEVRRVIIEVLGTGPGGFFEPGRLKFGEAVKASDIFQVLMALDGVENICLNQFRKIGSLLSNPLTTGIIKLEALEIAVCDNNPEDPKRGYYRLTIHGGQRG